MMKKIFFVFLLYLFCVGCIQKPAVNDILPKNTQTEFALPVTPTYSPLPAMTITPSPLPEHSVKFPVLTKGLPDGMIVNTQELPIRFKTSISDIPNGNYIVYSTQDQSRYYPEEEPTVEFWAVSIDTYKKYLLFICEKCEYTPDKYIAYKDGVIYFDTRQFASEDEVMECETTIIDLYNHRATRLSLDLSSFSSGTTFFHCTTSPPLMYSGNIEYIPDFHHVSPNGRWFIFGTAPAAKQTHYPDSTDIPERTHTLLFYSTEIKEWLILETNYGITHVLWTPNDELLVEVNTDNCGGLCGGDTFRYFVSFDDFLVRDVGSLFYNYDAPSPILTSIMGWFPDGDSIATILYDYDKDIILDGICPSSMISLLNTEECKTIGNSPYYNDMLGTNVRELVLSNSGIFYLGWENASEIEKVFFIDSEGHVEYRGSLYDSFIYEVSLPLNKILINTGAKNDILTYVGLDDVSVLSDFQVRVPNGINTAFWMTIP